MIFFQVETFGSMEKREKVEFILEQLRLCLAKKDYIRTQIISKKISTKFFEEKDTDVSVDANVFKFWSAWTWSDAWLSSVPL